MKYLRSPTFVADIPDPNTTTPLNNLFIYIYIWFSVYIISAMLKWQVCYTYINDTTDILKYKYN